MIAILPELIFIVAGVLVSCSFKHPKHPFVGDPRKNNLNITLFSVTLGTPTRANGEPSTKLKRNDNTFYPLSQFAAANRQIMGTCRLHFLLNLIINKQYVKINVGYRSQNFNCNFYWIFIYIR